MSNRTIDLGVTEAGLTKQMLRLPPSPAGSQLSVSTEPQSDEPELVLSESERQWLSVLAIAAQVSPASPHIKFDGDQILVTARSYAVTLWFVPPDAIYPLYKRVTAKHDKPFVPSAGEFNREWQEWDYFAEQARAEYKPAAALPSPATVKDPDAPGPSGFFMQMEMIRKRGVGVTCECFDGDGKPQTAVLSADKFFWVCYGAREKGPPCCTFKWPVMDTELTPVRKAGKGKPVIPASALDNEPQEVRAAAFALGLEWDTMPGPEQSRFRLHVVSATACRYNLQAMSEPDRRNFTSWVDWYKSKFESAVSRSEMKSTWEQFWRETNVERD